MPPGSSNSTSRAAAGDRFALTRWSVVLAAGSRDTAQSREALEKLCTHAKTGSKVRSVPMAPAVAVMQLTSTLGLSPLGAYHALMYGRSLYFDIGKAQRELNWSPRFSTDEMFAQSYDWYLANREKILRAHNASHHRSAVKQGVLSLVKHLL